MSAKIDVAIYLSRRKKRYHRVHAYKCVFWCMYVTKEGLVTDGVVEI